MEVKGYEVTPCSSPQLQHNANPNAYLPVGNMSELFGLKDGAYYCHCANILRISRYSDFLCVVLINTGIFLRGLKLCGESRT